MERRSFVQAIIAFLVSFFGRFTRLGRKSELAAAPKPTPTSPIGKVSPDAAWYSPETYRVVTTHQNMQAFVNERALLLGRPGITLDPQEGVEIMRLKNPAIRREVLGKRKPFGSPSPNPTGPVQAANTTVWQPLETFRPLSSGHPDLSSEETVLGAVVSLAVAPKFDISNNEAFEQVCGEHPAPNTDLSDEARQAIEANWDELLANWAEDTTVRVIDPTRLS